MTAETGTDGGPRTAPARVGGATEADPLAAIGPAFKATVAAHRRLRGRERRHPEGLRDAQYSLMFGLVGHDALSLGELAALADLSPAAATELLGELVDAGLVSRLRSERDRRIVLISLTDEGRALVDEHRAAVEPRWRAAFTEFSDDELRAAAAVLTRIGEFFEELAEER